MKRLAMVLGVIGATWLAVPAETPAQMFGNRRGSLNTPTAGQSEASLLRGNERFLRVNRRTRSFIGNDPRGRSFVGVSGEGSTGRVRPAAGSVRIQTGPTANQTPAGTVNRSTGMYESRLAVGFEVPARDPKEVSAALARQLAAIPGLHPGNRIEVSVEGETATLRGKVASERDRALAEKLILFEPGIAAVRNELKVTPLPPPSGQNPPPPARPDERRAADSPPAKTRPSGQAAPVKSAK